MKNPTKSITFSVVLFVCTTTAFAQSRADGPLQRAVSGRLRAAEITTISGATVVTRRAPFFSSGALAAARAAIEAADERAQAADAGPASDLPFPDLGQSAGTLGCNQRGSRGNQRVNQDCTFRRQAETDIAFNPAKPTNLLAGMNDSRVGFNQCGIAFSTDNGAHWGDMLPPFRQKVNNPAAELPTASDPNSHTIKGDAGTFHTYDAGSDPALAFDSQGRGFFSCIAFDVFSNASLLYVTQSPLGAAGSFFFNISTFGRRFVVAEDNSAEVFHDKEFIVADTFASSPNRDNVYVTWTVFRFSRTCGPQPNPGAEERYCSSPIFASMSSDHGLTWSTPEEISGVSPTICFFGNIFDPTRNPNACDFNQGADPTVLPNGNVVVVFNNGNTAAGNPNGQQLAVVCHPTGSSPAGTGHMNCAAPVKVGDDVTTSEPQCDFGRGPEECIPGAYIRTNDFPRIAVSRSNGHLYAVWQDYRNGEFDIQMARSLDGGATWGATTTVNPDRGLDHYFPATDIAEIPGQDRVGVSYYRTERVPNENTTPSGGFAPGQPGVQVRNSDYVLAGGTNISVPYNFRVVSPVFPPPDGIQAGFNGDYSGLTINAGESAHPIWSDTRNADPYAPANGVIHDEDIFTDTVPLPGGIGRPSVGQIGNP